MTDKVSYRHIANWDVQLYRTIRPDGGETAETATIQLAMLCAIRDELRALNALLRCPNFLGIPNSLSAIRHNTNKPKPRKRVKKPTLKIVGGRSA